MEIDAGRLDLTSQGGVWASYWRKIKLEPAGGEAWGQDKLPSVCGLGCLSEEVAFEKEPVEGGPR